MFTHKQVWNAIDTIAERIRALGYPAPGGLAAFAKLAQPAEQQLNAQLGAAEQGVLGGEARQQRAGAATAQGGGVVRVVVATGMHHQGVALHVGQLQARGQHGLGGGAVGCHIERGQVAQVAVAPGFDRIKK